MAGEIVLAPISYPDGYYSLAVMEGGRAISLQIISSVVSVFPSNPDERVLVRERVHGKVYDSEPFNRIIGVISHFTPEKAHQMIYQFAQQQADRTGGVRNIPLRDLTQKVLSTEKEAAEK